MAVKVAPGFSLTNRCLLYASSCLAPAQFVSGLGSNNLSNLGFLTYNWYTQIQWYKLVSEQQGKINAISLILPHFNLLYAVSYLGGVTSANIYMGVLFGLGTAGAMILNTIASWMAFGLHQKPGYEVYQFFFLGWRTFDKGWHLALFFPWQIADTLMALVCVKMALYAAIYAPLARRSHILENVKWWYIYPAIPIGALAMLILGWPLVLWTELIIWRNHLESETDMTAAWLFAAQVVVMLIPTLNCTRLSSYESGLTSLRPRWSRSSNTSGA